MALDPMWQSNYVDLSDERTIRFGGWCIVCGARYVAPDEPLDSALPHSPPPGSAAARAIEEAKFRAFVEFDAAFREMTVECYQCEHLACPDCWDEDNRMCGACVQTHGLPRSPQRGLRAGPLADGRLRRMEPGQYSDASRPGWLNQLLAAQPQAGMNGGQPGATDAMWRGLSSIAPGGGAAYEPAAAPYSAPGPTASSFATGPTGPTGPTASIASATLPPQPQPQTSQAPYGTNGYAGPSGMATHDFMAAEGRATSNMVQCPRCRTANYDFVTRCTVCQLQLIQICPLCERLNPAHAPICEACGSPLDRPPGWTGIQAPIVPLSTNQARKGKNNGSTGSRPWRRILTHRPKQGNAGPQPAAPLNGRAYTAAAASAGPPSSTPVPNSSGTWAVSAQAGSAMTMASNTGAHAAANPLDSGFDQEQAGALRIALDVSERIASLLLWGAILVLVGGIVAALVSPHADVVIKGIIHVDIRVALGNFWSWLQTLWHRYQNR
jgi:hypothetical protein